MKVFALITVSVFFRLSVFSQELIQDQRVRKTIVSWNDTVSMNFIHDATMYSDGWDTLPQTRFWSDAICLTSDSCIINIACGRIPVNKIHSYSWMNQSEVEKICYKDSVCRAYGLDSATNLFITAGKGEFYQIKKVIPEVSKAIKVFVKNNCDPWYAQAILLIESPGRAKSKSYVGANGPFQLMKSVAKLHGLRVNKNVDERTNLEKSAKAASGLINKSCIPYIRKFLDEHGVAYNESDLWFRLLVLHAYHAGAGNIHCVIDTINPSKGGVDLILKVWQTSCRSFKNESQNYSQIALASLLNFDRLINQNGDTVFLVSGDKLMKGYSRKNMKSWEAYDYLSRCLLAYETDFMDDMIPYDYFMKRISFIRKEFAHLAKIVSKSESDVVLKKYPSSEEHLTFLAGNLTRRKRYEDAIRLLKLNLDIYPESTSSSDSIAKLYRLTGDKKKAEFYSSRVGAVNKEPVKVKN